MPQRQPLPPGAKAAIVFAIISLGVTALLAFAHFTASNDVTAITTAVTAATAAVVTGGPGRVGSGRIRT